MKIVASSIASSSFCPLMDIRASRKTANKFSFGFRVRVVFLLDFFLEFGLCKATPNRGENAVVRA